MLRIIAGCVLGAIIAAAIGVAMAMIGASSSCDWLSDYGWQLGERCPRRYEFFLSIRDYGCRVLTRLRHSSFPPISYMFEVDTAGSGGATGVAFPPCLLGTSSHLQ